MAFKNKTAGAAYWDGEAKAFDSIYSRDGRVKGWLNRLLRRDMEGRYFFALEAARLDSHPCILEIGCGTGVHTKGFLEGGASFVTGIDLSSEMLKIAFERLRDYEKKFLLINDDFMNAGFSVPSFHALTAIGVFDYVAEPEAFMKRALALAHERVIATFPRSGTLRSRLRAVRLSLKGCPVYFYSKAQLDGLAAACGARIEQYKVIGQLHCAVFVHKKHEKRENPVGQ